MDMNQCSDETAVVIKTEPLDDYYQVCGSEMVEVKEEPELLIADLLSNFYDPEESKFRIKEEPELLIADLPPNFNYDMIERWQVSCYHCDYSCGSVGKLRRHIVREHLKRDHPFVSYRDLRRIYRRMSRDGKSYQCSTCSFSCRQFYHLRSHQMIHTNIKPFQCTECSYRSQRNESLKKHMLTHTEVRPFQCSDCIFSSRDSSTLRTHMLIHKGEKPYQCGICSYRCRHSGNLNTHMLIHTKSRPFQCSFCSYNCRRSTHLRLHLRRHSITEDTAGRGVKLRSRRTSVDVPDNFTKRVDPL